ncbi:MAG TPA: RNA polymerase sigma factor [Polyangiaceae bacterium]|nr:RNA polymerase sigma factor [Polyangiaceae bacterium]
MSRKRYSSRQVFDEHAPYVFRVLRYMGVREADVPDVCQEVFVTVHRKIDGFEGRSSIRTWLYKICQRAASDHRRRAYVRREVVTDFAEERPRAVESAGPRVEARSTLLFALGALDEDKRDVFVLYEIEGMTMREVAEVLGCPLQTAYSRLHAARELVEQALEREGGGKK